MGEALSSERNKNPSSSACFITAQRLSVLLTLIFIDLLMLSVTQRPLMSYVPENVQKPKRKPKECWKFEGLRNLLRSWVTSLLCAQWVELLLPHSWIESNREGGAGGRGGRGEGEGGRGEGEEEVKKWGRAVIKPELHGPHSPLKDGN